ncbi:MAG: hypothetical protein HOV73_01770 [Streptomyces sp.]|nr:hypothetical protein [Streptomyces sp.]
MITLAVLAAYIAAALMIVGFCRYHGARRALDFTRTRLENVLEQAARDGAFAEWGRGTMLTVTGSDAYIHVATIHQIYLTEQWDRIWDHPVAVALWHADPDTISRYRHEIDQEEGPK